MKLGDANVLRYAVNFSAARRDDARTWLDRALTGSETVGFAWVVLLTFLRQSTRHGVFPRPLHVSDAAATVGEWLAAPPRVVLEPVSWDNDFGRFPGVSWMSPPSL